MSTVHTKPAAVFNIFRRGAQRCSFIPTNLTVDICPALHYFLSSLQGHVLTTIIIFKQQNINISRDSCNKKQ